ncbi:MAG TPA: hypothetical protein VHX61_12915 [Rhizomicrobium sp.]|jgi:hypothetical protein|nr:hypothetical protein [Rhizomicrobium sp.]
MAAASTPKVRTFGSGPASRATRVGRTPFGLFVKWLDMVALCRKALPATNKIVAVNHYTAHVSGRRDAAATLPEIHLHLGNFITHPKWAGLAPPVPSFKPGPSVLGISPTPLVA